MNSDSIPESGSQGLGEAYSGFLKSSQLFSKELLRAYNMWGTELGITNSKMRKACSLHLKRLLMSERRDKCYLTISVVGE